MSGVNKLDTMLMAMFTLQAMFYMVFACVAEERIALMHIRSSFLESNSSIIPPSWFQSEDCCSWDRIKCSHNSARVSHMNLSILRQPFAEDWTLDLTLFSPFHDLKVLDLSYNYANLQNSDGLEGLTRLRCLNLSDNQFVAYEDIIPIRKLVSLQVLDLQGTINMGLSLRHLQSIVFRNLKKLRELHLNSNQLSGSIPSSLFDELPHLEYVDLSDNVLQGHIHISSYSNVSSSHKTPHSDMNGPRNIAFRKIKKLRGLLLASNELSGSIPTFLFELPRLEDLDLSRNSFEGHIPISSTSNIPLSLKALKLSENNLQGKFHLFWLRNCTLLERIELSGNEGLSVDVNFHGLIPPFQLTSLRLSGLSLGNNIIAAQNFLSTQRHLQFLDLSNNNLSGSSIPSWILTNGKNLKVLRLANNSLVGSLDLMWHQQQSSLQLINISMNYFEGRLPTNISSVFPNLGSLDASHNNILGGLPPSLCNITSIHYVDLSNNKFIGEVPNCMFTDFPILQTLKLSNNNFEGSILSGTNRELSVYNIYLDRNKFEGTLPSNLSGNTQILDLHDNKFSGQLSTSFWNLSYLLALSVASNNLAGEIDRSICKLTSIQVLDLSENNFSGSVPNCGNKLALEFLNMSKNALSGIPHRLFNGSYIRALDIRYNQFTGNLDWIQFLSQVKLLMLGGNMFEGQISESICHLHHLNILDLSHNRFSGPLAPCIGGISLGSHANNIDPWSAGNTTDGVWYYDSMKDDAYPEEIYYNEYDLQGFTFSTKGNLYTYDRKFFNSMFGIDLSGNLLSGEIPWEIGNLSNAKSLNLSHNFFTGQIPATLANISAVESLDLSHNKLSGTIPSELTQLWSLEVFSVAHNNLSGCIPVSGQFSTFSMESYEGNKNLHKMSPGNGCSAGSSPVAPAREHVGGALHDPVLSVVTAACFVLGFGATVVFSFCSSYGRSVMLKL